MAVFTTDPDIEERLREERAKSGADRFDEVWEGVLFLPPLANDEHQDISFQLAVIGRTVAGPKAKVYVRVNISDREDEWKFNYRVPDVAIFLPGNKEKNCGTHWFGGPDFLVEVASDDDRSWEKLPVYARVGVREVLIINRDPWQLELYRCRGARLILVGVSTLDEPKSLESKVVPLCFRLIASSGCPAIEVARKDASQTWTVQ